MAYKKLQLKYGKNHIFIQNFDEKENIPEHVPEPKSEPIISDMNHDINRGKKRMSDKIRQVIDKNSKFDNEEEMVVLGPNSTTIRKKFIEGIDWRKSSSAVAQALLKHIFGLDVLATHNLSGKKSPAFIEIPNMPEKKQLDPLVIADVIHFMYLTLQMSKQDVKIAVTSACANAATMVKRKRILGVKREELKEKSDACANAATMAKWKRIFGVKREELKEKSDACANAATMAKRERILGVKREE